MVEKKIIYNAKYERLKKVGEGTFAIAFLVKRQSDGLHMIAKVNKNESTFELARKEASRLASYNSKYIVKYYDSFTRETDDGDQFIIVTEYCRYVHGKQEGSDLEDFVETHGGQEKHLPIYKRII